MASRLELHEELCELQGSRNVYFQPPESVKIKYPCIIYSIAGVDQKYADDRNYKNAIRYEIIAIDSNPDSDILMKITNHFPMCRFDRGYTADNLNHKVFTIYY